MHFSIILLLVGILAAANLIIARLPAAKEYISKIAPYQGWIGLGALASGLWNLFWVITHLGILTSWPIVSMILTIGVCGLLVVLGFLLSIGVIKTFVKKPEAQAKMDQVAAKLAPFQGILGLISIGLGLASLILVRW